MAKFNLKKKSKRQPARLRYKVEKKIRQHNKKLRQEAKKNPKKNKHNVIQIPNICPFKEKIINELEAAKKQKEAEILRKREAARLERQKRNQEQKKGKTSGSLEQLVASAEIRGNLHQHLTPNITEKTNDLKTENSLKQHYKEFKKVIEEANVILEVVDARDPLGTRCTQVEEVIRDLKGNKRLVLVLNKADLVPREVLDKWLKYLRKTTPTIPFKASTQTQSKKLGQRKFSKSDKGLRGSSSVGVELLMSLVANYCRNKGVKTSIRVGIVGLPNVGKSSVINSLKRSRACNVGATPGVTRVMQEVQLDSKIKLLDSPGIVFAAGSDSIAALRNAVRIPALHDPITPANAILQRVTKQQMMEMYDITEYSTPDEFYTLKAIRTGKFKKGGIPDYTAAARGLLEDWNRAEYDFEKWQDIGKYSTNIINNNGKGLLEFCTDHNPIKTNTVFEHRNVHKIIRDIPQAEFGKIKYYTLPPEESESDIHVSSSIITDIGKDFDLDKFENMELEVLNEIEKESNHGTSSFLLDSLGPVDSIEKMDENEGESKDLLSDKITVSVTKQCKKDNVETRPNKRNPEMELEGNQKLNQLRKKQFKKEKKQRYRKEKIEQQLASGLENFSLNSDQNMSYDFNTDFTMK